MFIIILLEGCCLFLHEIVLFELFRNVNENRAFFLHKILKLKKTQCCNNTPDRMNSDDRLDLV
jgi:hypothetical protein